MSLEAIYTPSKWGSSFHGLTTYEALGAGSAGPGKSVVLRMDPLQQINMEHMRVLGPQRGMDEKTAELLLANRLRRGDSQGRALLVMRTFPMVEQHVGHAKRVFSKIDPGWKYDEQKHTGTFTSGYKYQFGHCQHSDSWDQYMGTEYTQLSFDELVMFDEEQYLQIGARLRSGDPVLMQMLKVRAMSNPIMKFDNHERIVVNNPFWVRQRFVDPAPQGKTVLRKKIILEDGTEEWRTRVYWPAKLKDNPDPLFVRNYETNLRDKPKHIQKALLEGDWYAVAGAFYGDDWDPTVHICRPFKVPSGWKVFRSLDWGFKSPGCIYWVAMDEDGVLYFVHEYTFQGKTPTEVAMEVERVEKKNGWWSGQRSGITGPADTQLWENRGDSGKSKFQEMLSCGVGWVAADKNRARGAERLLARIRDRRGGMSNVVFFESCQKAIKTIPAIPSEPGNPEVPMDGVDDHWHDAVRYACTFASHGRAGIPNVIDADELEDRAEALLEQRKRKLGRYGYGQRVC